MAIGQAALARLSRTPRAALAFVVFIGALWLNQGAADFRSAGGVLDAIAAPLQFLYRRAVDERFYFAAASATLGAEYVHDDVYVRGGTKLDKPEVPADGHLHLPYAEVPFEYPPPNLPFVLAPRLVAGSFRGYAWVFGALMGMVLALAGWLATRDTGEERPARLFALGLLLLAHGAIAIQRLDALVALLLVLAVRAALDRRDVALGVLAGLAGATKVLPILIVLLVAASDVRGRARWVRVAAGTALGLSVGLVPMLTSWQGVVDFVRYHGARGLHVESTLGVVYGALKAVTGNTERSTLDYGSFNFHGGVADVLAQVAPVLLLVLLGLVARAVVRREPPASRPLVLVALGGTLALWLGGKVFSPQYLTWALPLVVAIPGREWRRVTLGLGVVLVLSQLYFRGYYDYVYLQRSLGIVTMVVRLAVLGALFQSVLRKLAAAAMSESPPIKK